MDKLQIAMKFYQDEVRNYKYTVASNNGLTLDFSIEEDNLCHLLFGTIDQSIYQKPGVFKGKVGYQNMLTTYSTLDSLPYKIKKKGFGRIDSFANVNWLLEKPKGVHFNKNIILKGKGIKLDKSDLEADYLLYRINEMGEIHHLFLRNIAEVGKLVPVSFFSQKDDNYIFNQKEFNVNYVERIERA